jgi:glycosyltransferase involved in cell wall biosynthesis
MIEAGMTKTPRTPLRILMLATDAHGGFGGIAQYNRDVLDALSAMDGVASVVVVPRLIDIGVPPTGVPPARATAPDLAPVPDAIAALNLPPKVQYDLRGAAGRLAFIWTSLRQARGGGFDLIHCAHINLLPVATLVSRLTRAPLLLAIHGIDAWQPRGRLSAWLAGRAPALVVSVSAFTLRRFQVWTGTPDSCTALVPNTIRADRYGLGPKRPDLLARHGLHGKTVIMTFGRMAPGERYKGFDEVIASLPDLIRHRSDLVYLAAGDGPDCPRLQAKAQALGVADRVVFPGRIAEADKADYYRLADAYVMPSYGEGFGIVILEALACGIPVVASLADGTQEAVRAGALGLLVQPHDPHALQDAILQAIRQPKQIPAGLDYFSHDQFTRRLAAALDRATGAVPAQPAQRSA